MVNGVDAVIGVDAGASRMTGVLAASDGSPIAWSRAGGANLSHTEESVVARNFAQVLRPLLARGTARALCVGAAGAGDAQRAGRLEALLRPLVPAQTLLTVVHDGRIALRAATAARPALVVIAGTGSLAYGESADGTPARAGGYGTQIGDAGSAYEIGRAVLRHGARVLDGIERGGPLSAALLRELDAASVTDLIQQFERERAPVERIARLAMLVGPAQEHGDPIAARIVERQGMLLGALAARVAGAVRDGERPLPVALAGGAFDAAPGLAQAVTRTLSAHACVVSRLQVEAALGAAALALEARPYG